MTSRRYRVAILGFGRIAGFACDPRMARYYEYATHAQVLAAHPRLEWVGVLDRSDEARRRAVEEWGVPFATDSAAALEEACRPEVVVLSTPPGGRTDLLGAFGGLRGLLVEKPLGVDLASSRAFAELCRRRGLAVQVNYWRRGDETLRGLAVPAGPVGRPQSVFGVYGNGLANNGGHLVDLARMLAGEIDSVQAVAGLAAFAGGPIPGDANLPFSVRFAGGFAGAFHPLRFEHYREVGLTIWGESGRLDLLQEGLLQRVHPVGPNRGLEGEREVATDAPTELPITVGRALRRLHDNLVDALDGTAELWSPLGNAIRVAGVLEAALESARRGGAAVEVRDVLEA